MSSEERLRLFVAVDVPGHLLDALERATKDLRDRLPPGRWAAAANQHITVKFLGSTPVALLESVEDSLAAAASDHSPGELRLAKLGSFPSSRRARVLWIGLEDRDRLLASLAADLDERLTELGFEAEKRAYTPHLTLARWRDPVPVREPWPDLPPNVGTPFAVRTLGLYRSHLSPKGARYEVVRDWPLTGKSERIAEHGKKG
jgi:2'-5' RNA ligase